MLAQVVLWHGKLDFQPIFTELIILLSLFDLFRYTRMNTKAKF
jgi:hypothetical protein